jgi:Flp pilus assembly pilin Flp
MIASVVSIVILTAVLGLSSNLKAAYTSVQAAFN